MKILMFSDFHISNDFNINKGLHMIDKAYEAVSKELNNNETVIILVCGDIINTGDSEAFNKAEQIFDRLKALFSYPNIKFRFVPGNHDLCNGSLTDFDDFTHKYSDFDFNYSTTFVYKERIEDVNFIYASSVQDGNYNYGQLDYEQVRSYIDKERYNYFAFHHSPLSEDNQGEKEAVIRNSVKLFDPSFCPAPYYMLHGHYHGDRIIPIHGDGLIIEVGPIFYSRINVNNQFVLICLQDGSVDTVHRFTFEANYDEFRETMLYPFQNEKNLKNVKKIEYPDILNYIARKVGLFSLIQEKSIHLYFDDSLKKNLFDLCMEEKRVVLLGEAGCGKSIELTHLAFQLSKPDCPYYPVHIKLNTYTSENIEELIPKQYVDLEHQKLFFIFDGFDEIESKNLNQFARKLNAFTKLYPNTHILISCRNNFYTFEDTESASGSGTFSNFKEYGLCSLSADDINKYMSTQDISFSEFWDLVNGNDLNELLQNPFYLVEILKLYKNNSELPNRLDLMDALIKSKFKWDKDKYINTKDIEDAEFELLNLLQKIAFSLQCLQKVGITNTEYQQITTSKERELLKYSGVWLKDESGKWSFEHNNFREYLTAEYLISMPITVIKDLITYRDDRTKIRESWQNVLSFLALSYQNSELLDWIQKTDPSSVVKFEITRVSEPTREQIFYNIFNEYKEKNIWIAWNSNSGKDIAQFGQTAKTLMFLLNEIQNPAHFRAQSNAIYLLQNFTNLFGQEECIQKVLLSCCKNNNTRSYEKKDAIIALAQLGLDSTEVTNELYELFSESKESEIRYGLYTYFLKAELQDEFAEYFIKGLELELKNRDTDCFFVLKKGIKAFSKMETIKMLIEFYATNKNSRFHRSKEIFAEACEKLENFYPHNPADIFDFTFNCMVSLLQNFDWEYVKTLKQFFKNTHTVNRVIEQIIDLDKDAHTQTFLLEQFDPQDYMDIVAERYKENTLRRQELFRFLISEMDEDSKEFKEYQHLIFENEGIEISGRRSVDYEKLQHEGRQKYFNSLFNKEDFEHLLYELINLLDNDTITYDELHEQAFKFTQQRYDLQELVWGITGEGLKNQTAKNFLNNINWESYSIHEIYKILSETKNNATVCVNAEQKEFIYQYCQKSIDNIDFNTAVRYKDDGGSSCSWDVLYIAFFSAYFDFDYNETVLLDMLMIPTFFFKDENTDSDDFPKYILDKLSEKSINNRVKHNIDNLKLVGQISCTHIKYCKDKRLTYAVELAKEICFDTGKEWEKRIAFEYLLAVNGEDFIYQYILPNADDVLLEIIANTLYNNRNADLENRLISENKTSQNKMKYLETLIKMNSVFGMETYYTLALAQHSIPDYSAGNNICHITESIGEINDPSLLPQIRKLVELRFESGFKDKESFGLYNSLCKALKNIALNDYFQVKDLIQFLFEQSPRNSELRCFCSYLLGDIETQYYNDRDIPWTIKEVKMFLTENS